MFSFDAFYQYLYVTYILLLLSAFRFSQVLVVLPFFAYVVACDF